ncbi:MAG: TIGR02710 family CRISPR-associated CARF protein [Desulfitobacteriaceae bacterium]
MKRILVVTVGGSPEPIVISIKNNKPELVYFLASDDTAKAKGSYLQIDGDGLPCQGNPSIVVQAGLTVQQYKVFRIRELDNVMACRDIAAQAIQEAKTVFPNYHVLAEYTGGTKSMSAGLVLAAVEDGECFLSVVSGIRSDLIKVRPSTSMATHTSAWGLHVHQRIQEVKKLVSVFNFAGAQSVLATILGNPLPKDVRDEAEHWELSCRLFGAWDRFDLNEALDIMEVKTKYFGEYAQVLREVKKAREGLEQNREKIGFVVVWDMLNNAERCAIQKRFDDATGRMYRSLELIGQVALSHQNPPLSSTPLLENLPEGAKGGLVGKVQADGRVKLALTSVWTVLQATDPSISEVLRKHKGKLLSHLAKRNKSILAHGFTPVTGEDFESMNQDVRLYAREVEGVLNRKSWENRVLQFPNSFSVTEEKEK